MGRMVAPGTDADRVIQRVITRSVRGRWFGTVAEPAKEPERAFAQGLAAEQCHRDHREHYRNFGDGDDLTEQRVEHADAHGAAQRGSAGNSGPPGHPFARRE